MVNGILKQKTTLSDEEVIYEEQENCINLSLEI
jgi:hypothetical protein